MISCKPTHLDLLDLLREPLGMWPAKAFIQAIRLLAWRIAPPWRMATRGTMSFGFTHGASSWSVGPSKSIGMWNILRRLDSVRCSFVDNTFWMTYWTYEQFEGHTRTTNPNNLSHITWMKWKFLCTKRTDYKSIAFHYSLDFPNLTLTASKNY